MGKTFKIIVCGKKAVGKTSILEHLIYNNCVNNNLIQNIGPHGQRLSNSTPTSSSIVNSDRYFSTIEDIYVACWEKDKGVKEKLRFYDTKGMDNAKDSDTVNQARHLFSSCDGAVLIFSSTDPDSIQCIERLKQEIEKSKDKKEVCHFILIDNNIQNNAPNNAQNNAPNSAQNNIAHHGLPTENQLSHKEAIRTELQNRLRTNVYEFTGLEKRDSLCKPFIDLATAITQIPTKGSINLVQSTKKLKVFSSNK